MIRKAGNEEKVGIRKAGSLSFLVSWLPNLFLFSCFPAFLIHSLRVIRLPLVHEQLVSIRIAELRHPANWRFGLRNVETYAALGQPDDSRVDIVDLERNG